jgi:predicted ATPase
VEESGSTHESDGLRISLLGGFAVHVDGRVVKADAWPRRRAADVLKLLALAPDHQLHSDQVLAALWPVSTATAGRQSLHNSLYHARRVLDPSFARGGKPRFLAFANDVLRLTVDESVEIDVACFESAARQGLVSGAEDMLQQARDLYTGELLPEDRFAEWLEERREELRGLQLRVLTTLAAAHRAAGEEDLAIAELSRATEIDPLHEPAQAELIRTYAAAGLRHQAIMQYRRVVTRLNRELGERPSDELTTCFQEILDRTGTANRHLDRRAGAGRIPADIGRFVGRRRELDELCGLVQAERLITLSGPGGVGKTRLAVETARRTTEGFRNGVTFVELGDLVDGSLVAQAVCEALGAAESSRVSALDVAARTLREGETLLVLDTCEHVLEDAAHVALRLLRACPALVLLATSRQALGLPGEAIYAVRPLDLPADSGADPIEALRSDAVQLFLDRSRALEGTGHLDGGRVRAIVDVCRRVDGIPLGIELAAARTRALPVDQLAARLDAWLPLRGGEGDEHCHRQRTLRSTIDWSYRLLSARARTALARLSVFSGPWSLEAGETVVPDERLDVEAFLEALVELVDKSLVSLEEGRGRPQYRLLDTVREYAREQLEAAGDVAALQERHASALAAYLEQVDTRSLPVSAIEKGWLNEVAEQQDNVRSALEWSLEGLGDRGIGRRLAAAMRWYWSERCQFTEGRRWLQTALDADDDGSGRDLDGNLLVGLALLAWRQGDFEESVAASSRAVDLVQRTGDRWGEALALTLLGSVRQFSGDVDGGVPLTERALTIYRELEDAYGTTWQLANMARAEIVRGNPERAEALAREGLATSRAAGDTPGAGWALGFIGLAQAAAGNYRRAMEFLRDAAGLLSERDWWGADVVAASLVRVAALAGEPLMAARVGVDALERLLRFGSTVELSAALHSVAVVADVTGDPALAARLLGAADGDAPGASAKAALVEPNGFAADRARICERLGDAAFDHELQAGWGWAMRDAAEDGKKLLGRLLVAPVSAGG